MFNSTNKDEQLKYGNESKWNIMAENTWSDSLYVCSDHSYTYEFNSVLFT